MKRCTECEGALTAKDTEKGTQRHKICPPRGVPGSGRRHDLFPQYRAQLLSQRSVIMSCMREVAEKLEKGDLTIEHALIGAQRAAIAMRDITVHARAELED